MAQPAAVGMVLAMLVDGNGKPVRGGPARGQLYATADELVVLRPSKGSEVFHRATMLLLLGSIAVVLANVLVH